MEHRLELVVTEEARVGLSEGRDALEIRTPEGEAVIPVTPEQAAALLASRREGAEAPKEIERRFLVDALPSLPADGVELRQGYFLVTEDASVRVRDGKGRHRLTLKRGRGLARTEVELELSPEHAASLWPLTGDRAVAKTRYALPDGDGVLELDIYHGRHRGLVVVEREFSSLEAAEAWAPPPWASPEVTTDPRYTAARLALSKT